MTRNKASLTHGARLGIKPTSSPTQCRVLNPLSHNGNSSMYVKHECQSNGQCQTHPDSISFPQAACSALWLKLVWGLAVGFLMGGTDACPLVGGALFLDETSVRW